MWVALRREVSKIHRHVCWRETHQIKKHCIHDAGKFGRWFAMPHGRLWECWVEKNSIRAELFQHFFLKFSAFFYVIFFIWWSDKASGCVQREKEQTVKWILRATNYRFWKFAPQIFWFLKSFRDEMIEKLEAIKSFHSSLLRPSSDLFLCGVFLKRRNPEFVE